MVRSPSHWPGSPRSAGGFCHRCGGARGSARSLLCLGAAGFFIIFDQATLTGGPLLPSPGIALLGWWKAMAPTSLTVWPLVILVLAGVSARIVGGVGGRDDRSQYSYCRPWDADSRSRNLVCISSWLRFSCKFLRYSSCSSATLLSRQRALFISVGVAPCSRHWYSFSARLRPSSLMSAGWSGVPLLMPSG